jgi:hypothetical protein
VYCTGKASGCFFRHEMSDLLLYRVSLQEVDPYILTPIHLKYERQSRTGKVLTSEWLQYSIKLTTARTYQATRLFGFIDVKFTCQMSV